MTGTVRAAEALSPIEPAPLHVERLELYDSVATGRCHLLRRCKRERAALQEMHMSVLRMSVAIGACR